MKATKRVIALAAVSLAAALLLQGSLGTRAAAEQVPNAEPLSKTYRVTRAKDVEFQKIAPFKVFDNLYYVGPGYVSVWLLTTPQGDILFDSAQEPYVDHVIANIRKVGVDLKDIKYILLSHGHLDHFGGAARIQELSGARVGAVEEDWKMIEEVGSRPGRDGSPPPRVPKRDMVFKEGDTLVLGDQTLKFHQHPGHTPGVLSTEGITVYDGGKAYKAFVWGGSGYRGGVAEATQAVGSATRIARIQDIQVNLQIHSWGGRPYPGGGVLERSQKLPSRKPGDPHPFVDPDAWTLWVRQSQEAAVKDLAAELRKANR
jgi:metallo-beta-lactamase class B